MGLEEIQAAQSELEAAKRLVEEKRLTLDAAIAASASSLGQSVVARHLGVSRQAVQQVCKRVKPALSDADLDAEIRSIEAKWQALVEFYASQWGDVNSDRSQQARLNRQSAAKKARRLTKLSVKGSRLAFAETKLLALLREQRDQVPVFATALRELSRLDELLQERSRRNDLRLP